MVELKVCFNRIKEIDTLDDNMTKNLRVLDLESNHITDWKYLKKLGELKEY